MHYAVNSGRARFCVLTPRLFAIIYPGSRLSQSCTHEQKLLWKRRFCISSTSATLNQCRTNISSTACVNFPAASSARLLSTVFRGGAFRKTSTWLFLQIFLACRLALDIQWEGVGGRVGIYFRVCVCLATMPRQTKAPAVIRLTSRATAPEPATAFPLGCPSALRASQICANCHRSVKIHLCSRWVALSRAGSTTTEHEGAWPGVKQCVPRVYLAVNGVSPVRDIPPSHPNP